MKLKAIIHRAEEGGFRAEVPALSGCVSEGDSLEETIKYPRGRGRLAGNSELRKI